MDLVFRGGESPGYYPNTPPQHHKGRPRKRKVVPENEPCGEMPVTMRMAAATLGMCQNFLIVQNFQKSFKRSKILKPDASG